MSSNSSELFYKIINELAKIGGIPVFKKDNKKNAKQIPIPTTKTTTTK